MPLAGPYLRAKELAEELGISQRTVANWKRRRLIPHFKVGRVVFFSRAEVQRALDRFKIEAVEADPRFKAQGRERILWPTTVPAKGAYSELSKPPAGLGQSVTSRR